MNRFIYYLPRGLAVLIVVFLSLFILEGFSPEFSWQDSLSHFVLALIALLITILSWKKPKIGSWFFVLPGICLLLASPVEESCWLSLPLILIGTLFLFEGFRRK